jgi:hypothetical protein
MVVVSCPDPDWPNTMAGYDTRDTADISLVQLIIP